MTKCDYYLRCMPHFDVITDHRPLVGIFKKKLEELDNPTLQRLVMRTVKFNFEVSWRAGKDHLLADALSRAPIFPHEEEDMEIVTAHSYHCRKLNQLAPCKSIAIAGNSDMAYQDLISSLRGGVDKQKLSELSSPYKNVYERLSLQTHEDLTVVLLDNTRIVIPSNFRPTALADLHVGHLGVGSNGIFLKFPLPLPLL